MQMKRRYVLHNIKQYIAPLKIPVIILIITSIIAIPVSLISPRFFQILVDNVLAKKQTEQFYIVVWGLLGIYGIRFLLDGLNLYCNNRLVNEFTLSIRGDMWNKYMKVSLSKLEKLNFSDLKMRLMDDIDSLGNFIREQVVDYLFNILMVVFSLIMAVRVNLQMTLYSICIIPFVFLVNHLIGKGNRKVNEKTRVVNEKYYASTHSSLQYWKEIKSQSAEEEFVGRFGNFRKILAKLGFESIRYWFYSEVFGDFKANYLTRVFIYVIGTFYVINRKISVGELFMFAEYFAMLFSSLDTLNQKNVALNVNRPYYERVFNMMHEEEEHDEEKQQPALTGDIKVQGVNFKYHSQQEDVLHEIDLTIHAGSYTAIIGKSGCGKTTLMKLLLGIYQPPEGKIEFDGINVQDISKQCLYQQIGIVMQDSFLFNMSIRENLMLACKGAAEEDLIQACKMANIYQFIESAPEGFDTIIGERGIKISGGQKQRLCIAQALLKNPKLIIFDEATSSLDKLSEDIINQSINKISENTTVIVISHKPATVLRAEEVIVMEEGSIVDEGTDEELMERNSFYRELAAAN